MPSSISRRDVLVMASGLGSAIVLAWTVRPCSRRGSWRHASRLIDTGTMVEASAREKDLSRGV
jgi:hypothetical protein